ncbi:hypothetical protein [Croceicoccus sp. YJ47]|uniref:hypothetical protein n=1 Tax=Croceicoccus sp. YJ47 TaxID=2798724 RepID=UPI0019237CF7|nr:hypothetical protein [Croceicoccus sp. YJ47]QQN74319.1 hypothetical protein JD971_00440 [Croceicoccus sp. YJ47]
MTPQMSTLDVETLPQSASVADGTGAVLRVSNELAALAAGMDARFLDAGKTLMKAIETIDRLVAILKGISGALDGNAVVDAVTTMSSLAERLSGLPEALTIREGDLDAALTNSAMLKDRVDEVQKLFDVLQIYGVNTKIAAAGEAAFVNFVDDIDGRVDHGRGNLREISNMVTALVPSLSEAGEAVGPLRRECARIPPTVPERLAENACILRDHMDAMGKLAESVLTIAQEIQGQVALVLGALQVGDSTRQRIEHVVEGLGILDAHLRRMELDSATERAVRAHVYALLADLLGRAAEDFAEGANTLLQALRGIGPHTERLLSLIDDQAATEADSAEERTILQNVEHNIIEMAELTDRLHATDQQSNRLIDTIARTLVELGRKLEMFADLRIDVRNIAMNTLLLCRRMNSTGRAVFVIAKEIDRLCSDLGMVLDGMIALIDDLSENSVAIQATTDMGAHPSLEDALAIVRKGCDTNETGIEHGRSEARELIDLLGRTGTELANELALERDMIAASETLATASPAVSAIDVAELCPEAQDGLTAILAELAQRYSMAQEREIHRRHALRGAEHGDLQIDTCDPVAEEEDDDDDDGLF